MILVEEPRQKLQEQEDKLKIKVKQKRINSQKDVMIYTDDRFTSAL